LGVSTYRSAKGGGFLKGVWEELPLGDEVEDDGGEDGHKVRHPSMAGIPSPRHQGPRPCSARSLGAGDLFSGRLVAGIESDWFVSERKREFGVNKTRKVPD
jgi:hypothetical protein